MIGAYIAFGYAMLIVATGWVGVAVGVLHLGLLGAATMAASKLRARR
jgi:hypothetical protein